MKYIITESRLDKAVIKYLNMEYGDLKKFIRPDNERSVYYIKNRKIYMEHEVQPGELDIDASIWTDLQNIFSLKDSEIQRIIKKWASETYNINRVTRVYNVTPNSYLYDKLGWKFLDERYMGLYIGIKYKLAKCKSKNQPKSILFKRENEVYIMNSKVYMQYDLDTNELMVDYDTIWLDLEDTFDLNYDEIQRIITRWAESFWGLKGVKPVSHEF